MEKGGGAEGRGRGPWKVALMGLRDEQHGWGKQVCFRLQEGGFQEEAERDGNRMSLIMSREFHSPLGSGIKSWEGWSRGLRFFLITLVVM